MGTKMVAELPFVSTKSWGAISVFTTKMDKSRIFKKRIKYDTLDYEVQNSIYNTI